MSKTTKSTSKVVVYCGPTIPGVAKQYTVYKNGLTPALTEKTKRVPALGRLVLPLEDLPDAMRQMRMRSGPIYALFQAVTGQ